MNTDNVIAFQRSEDEMPRIIDGTNMISELVEL